MQTNYICEIITKSSFWISDYFSDIKKLKNQFRIVILIVVPTNESSKWPVQQPDTVVWVNDKTTVEDR